MPLLAFFFLAPILFVIIHAYILVHLVMLTDKAKRYHQALHRQIEDDATPTGSEAIAEQRLCPVSRRRAGTREGPFGWMLRAIGWTTLVIGPVLLLLLIQIQFLPFHNSFITWTHRLALLADLFLIWWLWRRIFSGREVDGPRSRRLSRLSTTLGLTFSACALSPPGVGDLSGGMAGRAPGGLETDPRVRGADSTLPIMMSVPRLALSFPDG